MQTYAGAALSDRHTNRRPGLPALGLAAVSLATLRLATLGLLSALCAVPAGALAQDAIPVTATTAVLRDVDIMAAGSGTVQAAQTALVRARVDGVIEAIHFREGQDVADGSELATIDTRPYDAVLAAAIAARDSDAARLNNARRDLARVAALSNTPAGSPQRVDTAASQVASLTADLRRDQAAVDSAQLNLSYCHITAPFAGVAGLRLVDPGNLVHANDASGIVSITQVQPISVVFTLAQNRVGEVQSALAQGIARVEASTTSDPRPIASGMLLAASNAVDPATGTIALKAQFDNRDRRLWPGELVTARVRLGVLHHAVTLPRAAVQRGPDGLYVYTLDHDDVVQLRPVTLAYEDDSIAALASGLAAGERVVLAGHARVGPGLRAAPSMVAP